MELDRTFPQQYEIEILSELPMGNVEIYYYPPGISISNVGPMVKIYPVNNEPWVGIFASREPGRRVFTGILTCPNKYEFCVVSKGEGYIVSSDDPNYYKEVELVSVTGAYPLLDHKLIIFTNPWEIVAYGMDGLKWNTGRIAIDGFSIKEISKNLIFGEIELGDERREFKVNIESGECVGTLNL